MSKERSTVKGFSNYPAPHDPSHSLIFGKPNPNLPLPLIFACTENLSYRTVPFAVHITSPFSREILPARCFYCSSYSPSILSSSSEISPCTSLSHDESRPKPLPSPLDEQQSHPVASSVQVDVRNLLNLW
ncbi:hypothetical protein KFK09_000656 [Dendrobium nobile]|uniref:Uncharacterized protein n=1 Tax=Dendrobium nobile TaxID=94219 RepID=A0A8T3C954_DENNO|nr:hypothetical protein KFK09_000656 [Dendrobium nobile]